MTGLFSYPKRKLRKLINDGEYEQAIDLGNELEEKFSHDPDFLFIMGSMYYILKDEKKSLHYLDRVLEINEFDVELAKHVNFTDIADGSTYATGMRLHNFYFFKDVIDKIESQ